MVRLDLLQHVGRGFKCPHVVIEGGVLGAVVHVIEEVAPRPCQERKEVSIVIWHRQILPGARTRRLDVPQPAVGGVLATDHAKLPPMSQPPEHLLFEGVSVEVSFGEQRPTIWDLLALCGIDTSTSGEAVGSAFGNLLDLQFSQIDDFYGVRGLGPLGDDVAVWLYPVIGDTVVHHQEGPFDALRLTYCVLRNPRARADHYLRCVASIGALGTGITYEGLDLPLEGLRETSRLRSDIDAVTDHWASEGISVGSNEAMQIDF